MMLRRRTVLRSAKERAVARSKKWWTSGGLGEGPLAHCAFQRHRLGFVRRLRCLVRHWSVGLDADGRDASTAGC